MRVFISHSHSDRDFALNLNGVLLNNGAETFLDQEHIEAGDTLPSRLNEGIRWCELLLLLWSGAASRSRWVQKEWDLAYEKRKRILPYRLDRAPLPEVLGHIVYVDSDDRTLGHANLLRAVFGKDFQPVKRSQPFPGKWRVTIDPESLVDHVNGMNFGGFLPQGGGYELDLRKNGQVTGTFSLGQFGGALGAIFGGSMGMMNMKSPVRGDWQYDADSQVLTLNLTANVVGRPTHDVIEIVVLGDNTTELRGESTDGRSWIVERLR